MPKKQFIVNGIPKTVISNLESSLTDVLRKPLILTGTKNLCCEEYCGACSVFSDSRLTFSRLIKMNKVGENIHFSQLSV